MNCNLALDSVTNEYYITRIMKNETHTTNAASTQVLKHPTLSRKEMTALNPQFSDGGTVAHLPGKTYVWDGRLSHWALFLIH